MPKGAYLEILVHRWRPSLICRRSECGINFRSISRFQAYTNNKCLRYASKAFRLKMSNDAFGSTISWKIGYVFHLNLLSKSLKVYINWLGSASVQERRTA
jgi:hypothetical protein